MLQKQVGLSHPGNLGALFPGVSSSFLSPGNYSQRDFKPQQEQTWGEEGQQDPMLVANVEKGLSYLQSLGAHRPLSKAVPPTPASTQGIRLSALCFRPNRRYLFAGLFKAFLMVLQVPPGSVPVELR